MSNIFFQRWRKFFYGGFRTPAALVTGMILSRINSGPWPTLHLTLHTQGNINTKSIRRTFSSQANFSNVCAAEKKTEQFSHKMLLQYLRLVEETRQGAHNLWPYGRIQPWVKMYAPVPVHMQFK